MVQRGSHIALVILEAAGCLILIWYTAVGLFHGGSGGFVLPVLVPLIIWRLSILLLALRRNRYLLVVVALDLVLAGILPATSVGGLILGVPLFIHPYFLLGPVLVSALPVLLATFSGRRIAAEQPLGTR